MAVAPSARRRHRRGRPCASRDSGPRFASRIVPSGSRHRRSTLNRVEASTRPRPKWRSGGRLPEWPVPPSTCADEATAVGQMDGRDGPDGRPRSRSSGRDARAGSRSPGACRARRAAAGAARGNAPAFGAALRNRNDGPHWLATAKSSRPSPSTSAMAIPRLRIGSASPRAGGQVVIAPAAGADEERVVVLAAHRVARLEAGPGARSR